MKFIKHKILIFFGFMLFSSVGTANESDKTFEEFSKNPANYCFGQIKDSDEAFRQRWDIIMQLAPRSVVGEIMTNPLSPSFTNIISNVIGNYALRSLIVDPSKDMLDDGGFWLHPANTKHYGSIAVTHAWNSTADFAEKRSTYFEGSIAHFPAYSAYMLGGCIPSIEAFRSLGYQFELGSLRTSRQTTYPNIISAFYMFANSIPILHGSPSVQYNYYLPPGGPYVFWDIERGVVPRWISYAGYDNPDPFKNVTDIPYYERTGDPITREVEPADFEGFAPGGYELHLFLKKRMEQASVEFEAGTPVADIAKKVREDVANFKKTLPPVPEGFLPPTKIFTRETFKEEQLGAPDLRVVQHIKRSGGGMFDCFWSC